MMENELKGAIERAEMGWNADEARSTLAESMQTISTASRIAKRAVSEMENNSGVLSLEFDEIREFVENARAQGLSRKKGSETMTRKQAWALLSCMNRILKAIDVSQIIRLSLDLTSQTKMFVDMMERVEKRYGAQDRAQAEDITNYLNTEQLMQVHQWVQENKALSA